MRNLRVQLPHSPQPKGNKFNKKKLTTMFHWIKAQYKARKVKKTIRQGMVT